MDVGAPASKVLIKLDSSFEYIRKHFVTNSSPSAAPPFFHHRAYRQLLSTTTIHPIVYFFKPVPMTHLKHVCNWVASQPHPNDNKTVYTLPAASYGLDWQGPSRDVTNSYNLDPSKLVQFPSNVAQPPVTAGIDIFVRLFLARVWGMHELEQQHQSDTQPNNVYCSAAVKSSAIFALLLQPMVGHRDFIRIVHDDTRGFNVHPDTSLILEKWKHPDDDDDCGLANRAAPSPTPTQNVPNSPPLPEVQSAPIHCSAYPSYNRPLQSANTTSQDKPYCTTQKPWAPHIGFTTTTTVTYLVLPVADDQLLQTGDDVGTDNVNDRLQLVSQKDIVNGVHVTCTTDISGATYNNKNRHSVYFEYVSPASTHPLTRQFFVPIWTAFTLPASVAVRFSSHQRYRINVIGFVHHYAPQQMFDPLRPLEMQKSSKMAMVKRATSAPPPFCDNFLSTLCDPTTTTGANPKIAPTTTTNKSTPKSNSDNASLLVGTIPVYKTLQNVDLRKWIKHKQKLDSHTSAWGDEETGIPCCLWRTHHLPTQYKLYNEFSPAHDTLITKKISTLPLKEIRLFLKTNKHLDSIYFDTSMLNSCSSWTLNNFILEDDDSSGSSN